MSNPIIWLDQFWLFVVSVRFPDVALVFKIRKCSHRFYRVTPHTGIICKMRNSYLRWLILVSVDVIRDKLHKWLDWLLCRHCTRSLHGTNCHVYSTICKKRSFRFFRVSSVNLLSKWIWCMETLITYHMHLFWHGRVWRHCLRHMGREMTLLSNS